MLKGLLGDRIEIDVRRTLIGQAYGLMAFFYGSLLLAVFSIQLAEFAFWPPPTSDAARNDAALFTASVPAAVLGIGLLFFFLPGGWSPADGCPAPVRNRRLPRFVCFLGGISLLAPLGALLSPHASPAVLGVSACFGVMSLGVVVVAGWLLLTDAERRDPAPVRKA
ncbi:MAG: hypothetical protein U1E56_01415 [Bauldia sp.]